MLKYSRKEGMVSKKKYWKVGGNKVAGYHLIIPRDAYLTADQPKAYTCAVMQDGTLVYQPVKDNGAHP